MEVDDLELVDRARAGDAGAFHTLVVRYQRKVYAVALGIVKDPDLAWDVAQDAFVRVHQNLATFRSDSSFSTWVLRIATHISIDAVRKERRSLKDDVADVAESALFDGAEGILSTALGTNINRRLGDILAGQPCAVVRDEPSILGGMYRVVLLEKR